MTATHKTKMVDKLTLGKKLVALLKKRYRTPLPKQDRPVLETLLFAICLEYASVEQAEESYERLFRSFHDFNELRVSSISELAAIFQEFPDAEWRAHRIKSVLQYVFEKHFEFAFESLRRKTLELATKQLCKIRDLTPFDRNYTLQSALGTHIVPVDRRMTNACVWMGLVGPGESPEHAAETLKSVVRKADVPVFCHYLRCLAVDSRLIKYFENGKSAPPQGENAQTSIERLLELFKQADAAARKSGKRPPSGRGTRGPDGHDRANARSKAPRSRPVRGTASERRKR